MEKNESRALRKRGSCRFHRLLDIVDHRACIPAQRAFWIEPLAPAGCGDFKKQLPQTFVGQFCRELFHPRNIDAGRHGQFLFIDLLPHRLGKHQRRQTGRLLLEQLFLGRNLSFARFFLGFDLFPLDKHLIRVRQFVSGAKNMRMTADELLVHFAGHILEVEIAALFGELRVKNHLNQHVAEFLPHMREIELIDRLKQFAAFVDQTAGQTLMRLLLIPGTAARGSQPGDGVAKFLYGAHPPNLRGHRVEHTAIFRLCLPRVPRVPWQGMSDKLTEIMAWKRVEIADRLRPVSDSELSALNARLPRAPSFEESLKRTDGRLAVISEIKRRSPSAGDIKAGASSLEQALRYQAAGADALSILTDDKYFGGTLEDLRGVTSHFRENPNPRPCLRKDFMVHPIQVLEAREAGASAILIIVRALNDDEISILHAAAKAAGLDALFEIHNEAEIERAVHHGARIIGVNNRDLAIFKTDLGLSERLIPLFPRDVIAVSESGIHTPADAARARDAGAHAILVGEALMRAPDPSVLLSALATAGG